MFNPRSGDIHLFSLSAYELWRLTAASPPRTTAALIDALATDAGRPVDDDFISSARETLAFMDRAGLVAPVQ